MTDNDPERHPDRDNDWIARRAYSRWEEEGRPHGRDADHWHAALQDWQTLQAASDGTTNNAGRRIAEAQASAIEDSLAPSNQPARPARAVKAPKR
ncbi:DUF2934 domain-containing protein [Rhizobium sp. SL42]|uniref:DUF2934 domain-containing protein n=1 Tax=Rhizobium sp. SL42 TaxID=2806346 RepID=UPI001F23600F|nr:DUF2934 domain-containing protein [Rhizobium sp. SL42]UJW76057.1 DUF2934 domain-containing protein [Rhizobium sp. SL42]